MRRFVSIGVAAVASIGSGVGSANPAAPASGRLAGRTQISFGCPGPVQEGTPGCNPWHPFAHARFSLAQPSASGRVIPGTRRIVSSDARGRFALQLPVGTYRITPLAQRQTLGGARLTVRVRRSQSTTALVRFRGYPQME